MNLEKKDITLCDNDIMIRNTVKLIQHYKLPEPTEEVLAHITRCAKTFKNSIAECCHGATVYHTSTLELSGSKIFKHRSTVLVKHSSDIYEAITQCFRGRWNTPVHPAVIHFAHPNRIIPAYRFLCEEMSSTNECLLSKYSALPNILLYGKSEGLWASNHQNFYLTYPLDLIDNICDNILYIPKVPFIDNKSNPPRFGESLQYSSIGEMDVISMSLFSMLPSHYDENFVDKITDAVSRRIDLVLRLAVEKEISHLIIGGIAEECYAWPDSSKLTERINSVLKLAFERYCGKIKYIIFTDSSVEDTIFEINFVSPNIDTLLGGLN